MAIPASLPHAPSGSPSPLHPAPIAPVRKETIDPAPAAAIVPTAGVAAPPPQCVQGENPLPSQAHCSDSGGLSCNPTCTQEKGLARPPLWGQVWTQLLPAGREVGVGSPG